MSDDSSFLARWARRKQEVQRSENDAAAEQAPSEPLSDEDAVGIQAGVAQQVATVCELPADELALLPSIQDLTAHTDITQFLRAGVPAVLRNAALRRMWALDPAIRDYVGEALDYAYDWNVPGGVPGSGPLLASDDVPGMLRQIMGNPEASPPESVAANDLEPIDPVGEGPAAVANGSQESDSESANLSQEIGEQPEAELRSTAPSPLPDEGRREDEHPIGSAEKSDEAKGRTPHRRHGGAVPS